jgi:hypothetical protein
LGTDGQTDGDHSVLGRLDGFFFLQNRVRHTFSLMSMSVKFYIQPIAFIDDDNYVQERMTTVPADFLWIAKPIYGNIPTSRYNYVRFKRTIR